MYCKDKQLLLVVTERGGSAQGLEMESEQSSPQPAARGSPGTQQVYIKDIFALNPLTSATQVEIKQDIFLFLSLHPLQGIN